MFEAGQRERTKRAQPDVNDTDEGQPARHARVMPSATAAMPDASSSQTMSVRTKVKDEPSVDGEGEGPLVDGCDSLYQLFEQNPKWFAECVEAQTTSYQQIRDKILAGRNTGIHDYSHMRARGKEAEYEMMCLSVNLQVVEEKSLASHILKSHVNELVRGKE